MLQKLRERLTLILLVLLPFHALLVTVGTKMLEGPGHAPMTELVLWKEFVLLVLMALVFFEWIRGERKFSFDALDWLIVALLLLSIAVTVATHGDLKLYLFGFKYDFVPLVAFIILRRAQWSEEFITRVLKMLMVVGGIVATYGLASFFLPQKFFVALGYSELHSLYLPDGPIAAYQQIGGEAIRRIQSTMSGPNQLGLWLLLPWSIAIISFITCQRSSRHFLGFIKVETGKELCFRCLYLLLIGAALLLTFSRSAWIAAFVIVVTAIGLLRTREESRKTYVRLTAFVVEIVALIALIMPNALWRLASSRDHVTRPLAALQMMAENPYGLGLGIAGPASNRVSDACVQLEPEADASWAENHPDLCVFVGDTQVQPKDRACQCPLLPENWYLQIGLEMGVLGLGIFITLILFLLRSLRIRGAPKEVLLFFFGVSIDKWVSTGLRVRDEHFKNLCEAYETDNDQAINSITTTSDKAKEVMERLGIPLDGPTDGDSALEIAEQLRPALHKHLGESPDKKAMQGVFMPFAVMQFRLTQIQKHLDATQKQKTPHAGARGRQANSPDGSSGKLPTVQQPPGKPDKQPKKPWWKRIRFRRKKPAIRNKGA